MVQFALTVLLLCIAQVPVEPGADPVADPPQTATASPATIAVQLDTSGDDPVGSQLADKLRAAFSSSPRFRLTTDNSERRLIIVIQHIDRACRQRNLSTVYSVIWTHNPGEIYYARYLTATVGFTPVDGVDKVVADLVLETESLVDRLGLE